MALTETFITPDAPTRIYDFGTPSSAVIGKIQKAVLHFIIVITLGKPFTLSPLLPTKVPQIISNVELAIGKEKLLFSVVYRASRTQSLN